MTSKNMGSFTETSNASTMNNDNTRDRLSELPDDILVHILSYLPLLDAVRTVSIRGFGNLWTLLSSLDFNDSEYFEAQNWPSKIIDVEQRRRITGFLNNVTLLHKRTPINKFILCFNYKYTDETNEYAISSSDINSWIEFAIDRQVKELKFQLESFRDPGLLGCVFTSESLVVLELVNCAMDDYAWLRSQVQMRSLRKLSLIRVSLWDDEETLQEIISGCPCLQELVLKDVQELEVVEFTAPNIEKLVVESSELRVLDCPNLKILNIHLEDEDDMYLQECNIPCVYEVDIQSIRKSDRIVNKILNVEAVKFSNQAFQHLKLKKKKIKQNRWKRLHIELHKYNEDHLIDISRVLRSSPHLEELIVFSTSRSKIRGLHKLSEELSFPCEVPQLESVTIHVHRVPCQGLLRLAEFLLKSCVNLEKMVISTYKLVPAKELKFVKRICSFPRASTNARLIFGSEVY